MRVLGSGPINFLNDIVSIIFISMGTLPNDLIDFLMV